MANRSNVRLAALLELEDAGFLRALQNAADSDDIEPRVARFVRQFVKLTLNEACRRRPILRAFRAALERDILAFWGIQ